KGIASEIFHENAKFDKQFKYADRKGIPYAVIMGSKELQEGNCIVKDLRKGEQKTLLQSELINHPF
ncbi:MAG TPA: His/Gly/Thr/Pro-type tRNA ligase C-terminal domain-containing protein, partial [Segetibacter sp.]